MKEHVHQAVGFLKHVWWARKTNLTDVIHVRYFLGLAERFSNHYQDHFALLKLVVERQLVTLEPKVRRRLVISGFPEFWLEIEICPP